MSKKSKDELNNLSLQERAMYFASGRATVGEITQVENKKLKHSYVGKVRGFIVSNGEDCYKFETPEQARECARWFIRHSKRVAEQNTK